MTDHVKEWLGAFHDGELHGARLRQVEQHLAECAFCQAELEAVQRLSTLLQENDPQAVFINPERFAANILLRLPRQPEKPQSNRALTIGWWLIPVGLLAAWLFIDISISLTSIATLTANSSLLGNHLGWLPNSPLQMNWFAEIMELFGSQLGVPERLALSAFNEANVFIAQIIESLIPQAVLAAAYLGWLLAWWLSHQDNPEVSFHDLDLSNGS